MSRPSIVLLRRSYGTGNYASCHAAFLRRPGLLLGVLAFMLALGSARAQIQQAWVAHYNNGIANGTNQAVKMALDSAGNIYITGVSENTNSQLGYVTIKYAPNGNQIWVSRYDSGTYPTATPAAMVLDSSNTVIVTGSALTIKYDPNGNLVWTAPYAGTALACDGIGNIYVGGFGTNFNTVKLAPEGTNSWLTTYNDVGPTISQSVLVDNGNNVYVSGLDSYQWVSTSEYNPDEGYFAVALTTIKYDSNGNQIWEASQADGGSSGSVVIGGASLDTANNLYLVANFGAIGNDYVTLKYASNGNPQWMRFFGPGNGGAFGLSLDSASNVLVTGQYPHDYPNLAYGTEAVDTNGNEVWISYYPQVVIPRQSPGIVNSANGIATDANNNAYVTGYSPGTNSLNDIVTIAYGPNGNQLWLQRYNGPGNGNDVGNAIAVDNSGNVYVSGYDTTTAGGTEIVAIKYSPLILQPRSDGSVLLQAQGAFGESFEFLGSTDLLNWVNLGSVAADSNGLAQFTDTNAPNYPARFYNTSPQ